LSVNGNAPIIDITFMCLKELIESIDLSDLPLAALRDAMLERR
jgi:hypothetical protein